MSTIRLSGLGKSYGGAPVMSDINLVIESGEFVVLLGPSGCGKSTLLRMIAGLEEISSGEISIDERVINDVPPGMREIALVFQNYALYPHMNVFDNIAFGLRRLRVPNDQIKARVHQVAKLLHISDLLDRRPRQMSGGQQQRVAIARAMIKNPKVYLFDEPLSNLDAKLRDSMRLELKRLHRNQAATTVFVTHDQLEAMTLADRIVVMNKGKIEQVGSAEEVYYRPRTLFAAKFVGTPTINLFSVTATDRNKFEGEGLLFEAEFPSVPMGGRFIAGIRPRDFVEVSGETSGALSLVVDLTEMMGDETLVEGTLGDRKIQILVPYSGRIKEGDVLHFSVRTRTLKLFHEETGLAVLAE